MRRSVREALVGFSVLAGLVSGMGLWLWLKGISLRRDVWTIRASFTDAAGLADRSPVSFRGVLVGSVRRIQVTERAVVADLEITDPGLRLSRPVVARVAAASLLGGDAQVSLLSAGQPLPANSPRPRDRACDNTRMVCHGGQVKGVAAASLDTVTETVQQLLNQAEREKLVPQLVAATRSFEQTARETGKLSRQGQLFVEDARGMVKGINASVDRAQPIITNINAASVDAARATRDAAKASRDVSQVTGTLNRPATLADLRATIANARQLTERWEQVGGDVRKLTGDPRFIDGVRSVAVGLGSFFEELYPAKVDAARQREERRRERAGLGSEPPPVREGAEGGGGPSPGAGPSRDTPREQATGLMRLLPEIPAPGKERALSAADQRERAREREARVPLTPR